MSSPLSPLQAAFAEEMQALLVKHYKAVAPEKCLHEEQDDGECPQGADFDATHEPVSPDLLPNGFVLISVWSDINGDDWSSIQQSGMMRSTMVGLLYQHLRETSER